MTAPRSSIIDWRTSPTNASWKGITRTLSFRAYSFGNCRRSAWQMVVSSPCACSRATPSCRQEPEQVRGVASEPKRIAIRRERRRRGRCRWSGQRNVLPADTPTTTTGSPLIRSARPTTSARAAELALPRADGSRTATARRARRPIVVSPSSSRPDGRAPRPGPRTLFPDRRAPCSRSVTVVGRPRLALQLAYAARPDERARPAPGNP